MEKAILKNLFEDNFAGAVISPNKLYRYALWRTWDEKLPFINFVGLNPSEANVTKNDRTIRRLIKFTQDWGYGGFYITNLFALRDKSPKQLLRHPDISVGRDNDSFLLETSKQCKKTVFCWGNGGTLLNRDKEVIQMFPDAMCFGTSKDGHPLHPLYLKKTTTLVSFSQTAL